MDDAASGVKPGTGPLAFSSPRGAGGVLSSRTLHAKQGSNAPMTSASDPIIEIEPRARETLLALAGTGEHAQYVRIHVGRG